MFVLLSFVNLAIDLINTNEYGINEVSGQSEIFYSGPGMFNPTCRYSQNTKPAGRKRVTQSSSVQCTSSTRKRKLRHVQNLGKNEVPYHFNL
jgi:hypothetical protein